MVPRKRLVKYPPKTGQTTACPRGTDTSLADFFLDKVTIPGTDLTFWKIIKNRASQPFLQANVDIIMPMLCPSCSSYPNSNAPLLSVRLLYLIQTNPEIASKYLCGVFAIMHFLGFELNDAALIRVREGYEACAARIRKNQNQWQIYQLIRSLLACGFYGLAQTLFGTLLNLEIHNDFLNLPGLGGYKLSKGLLQKLFYQHVEKFKFNGPDYWKAQIEHEYAFEDGEIFDQTLPPKNWVSYQVADPRSPDPLFLPFEENSPPLLERKKSKRYWHWHLPYLQVPSNATKRA